MKTTIFLAVVVCMLGLMGVASRRQHTKMAICEITSTSGVYPIYGTITLTQTNCPCMSGPPDHSGNRPPGHGMNCSCMNEPPDDTGNKPPGHDMRGGNITIKVSLKGFNSSTTQKHGFHVHQHGDLGNQCKNAGGHFNPANVSHGAPSDFERHVGDLGNVEAVNGVVETTITDWLVTMFGPPSVIGKSIVVHEGEDDLGRGNNSESLRTGNAGPRYGCCIITEVERNETMRTTTQPTGYTTTAAGSVAGVSSLLLLQLIAACILSDRRH